MTNPVLSVVIPVLNLQRRRNPKRFFMPRQTIQDLLPQIRTAVNCTFETVIICNGQERDLRSFVESSAEVTRYALNSVNVGVARSWNMGLHMSKGQFVAFLNDDVELGENDLTRLLSHLHPGSGVGVVGPEGSIWRDLSHVSYVISDVPSPADVISGFCFVTPRTLALEVGGFDDALTPAGYEEVDYCLRVREAGLTCVVDPQTNIRHHKYHGVSSMHTTIDFLDESIDTIDLHARNTRYMHGKWANRQLGIRSVDSGAQDET